MKLHTSLKTLLLLFLISSILCMNLKNVKLPTNQTPFTLDNTISLVKSIAKLVIKLSNYQIVEYNYLIDDCINQLLQEKIKNENSLRTFWEFMRNIFDRNLFWSNEKWKNLSSTFSKYSVSLGKNNVNCQAFFENYRYPEEGDLYKILSVDYFVWPRSNRIRNNTLDNKVRINNISLNHN